MRSEGGWKTWSPSDAKDPMRARCAKVADNYGYWFEEKADLPARKIHLRMCKAWRGEAHAVDHVVIDAELVFAGDKNVLAACAHEMLSRRLRRMEEWSD